MIVELWNDPALWDAYVDAAPDASNYHRWVWKEVIEEAWGHQTYYFAAVNNGTIQGVLPLVWMKSRLFGSFLVSMPFFTYGGVLASNEQARVALVQRAIELARDRCARHIELRQGVPSAIGWHDTSAKVTMEVPLPAKAEELWNRLSSKHRKRIRYAVKNGLSVEWNSGDAVGEFYPIFAANMRNLGTPVYSRAWFEVICRRLGDEIRILTVRENGRAVAAAFVTAFRETLELPWAASMPEAREKFSPLLLYWSLLEWATQNGYRRVDLGRCTPGSGNYEFKRHWLCDEKPLHWYYWLSPGAALPELRPSNPRYGMLVNVWKRLPLPVANRLGPHIVRSIP